MKKGYLRPGFDPISSLRNFLSGVLLKVSNPFKKGDFIEIDGHLGAVKRCGLQKTLISNLDGSTAEIDNSKFYSGNLHNLSTENILRVTCTLNFEYTANMTSVKEDIHRFLQNNPQVLKNPAPRLHVSKLKEKSVEISIQSWCLLDHFVELDNSMEMQMRTWLTQKGFAPIKKDFSSYKNLKVTAGRTV